MAKEKAVNWADLPDTITAEDLAAVLGVGLNVAREIFNSADFPAIPTKRLKIANKEAVRLWTMGIKITDNIVEKALIKILEKQIKNNDLVLERS